MQLVGPYQILAHMISASDALKRLEDGNRRFVAGEVDASTAARRVHRTDLSDGQSPFAIVLACSDSRVPVEIVFNQGFGDLFVIRVAGNIVAASQLGSIEYAAQQFGTRLVVVLGHSNCGAVTATLEALASETPLQSPNLRAIVDRVGPAVEPVLASYGKGDASALTSAAVRANVRASVEQLSQGSQVLEQLIANGELDIVGAEYSLETGSVEFFDNEKA